MKHTHTPTRHRRRLAWSACAVATILLAGCNVVTPVYYAVAGPGKVKKSATLDSELKHVIFVDDPANKVSSRRLRSTIVDTAQSALLARGTVKDMIDGRSAYAAVSKERYGEPLSIVEIGESVGADIVIYALLTEFSLGAEVGTYRPQAVLQVKIMDVRTGQRIWPASDSGTYPLRVTLPQKPGLAPSTTGELYAAQEELAGQAGRALAEMFYDVEVTRSSRRTR